MKKILFFLMAAAAAYGGAMYRYMPLMALAAAELILLAVMGLLSRYLLKRVDVKFVKKGDEMEAGGQFRCGITVRRCGILPGGRLRLCLTLYYEGEEPRDREYLWGSSGAEEERLDFSLSAARCGLLHIRMEQLRVYDYLGMFHPEKELFQEMAVAVFPGETALEENLTALAQGQIGAEWEQFRKLSGENYDEVRQIRSYLPGDPVRHIHWNQSARTDSLWIREYEAESEKRAVLWLDGTAEETEKWSAADSFCRLVSALIRCLLRQGVGVRVIWEDRLTDQRMRMDVCAGAQVRELLYRLYRCELAPLKDDRYMTGWKVQDGGEMYFSLDMNLCWYSGGRLLRRFSAEELKEKPQDGAGEQKGRKI